MLSGSLPDTFIVMLKSVPVALSKFNVILTREFGIPLSMAAVILVLITERLMINLCDAVFVLMFIDWLLKIVTFNGELTVKFHCFVVFLLPAVSLTYANTVVRPGVSCETLMRIVQLPESLTAVRLNPWFFEPLLIKTTRSFRLKFAPDPGRLSSANSMIVIIGLLLVKFCPP